MSENDVERHGDGSDDSGSKLRLFFAIALDAGTRAAVSDISRALRDSPAGGAVRWVREESLHVTLRFLGPTESARVAPLAARVRQQAAAVRPFRLEFGAVRPFPSKRRPRFVVLDVGPTDRLEELAEAVERGVVEAGFAPESRPFRAHMTLGRIRNAPPGSGAASSAGKKFSSVYSSPVVTGDVTTIREGYVVEDAVLFDSDLNPSGARYTPLERIPLGDNDSPLIT